MVHSLIRDPKTGKYLVLKWKKQPWTTFVVGGVDEGESLEAAARREIAEEVGYTDLSFKRIIMPPVYSEYFAAHKDENRFATASAVVFELTSEAQIAISPEEEAKHEPYWMTLSDLENDAQFTCAEFVVWKHMLDHDRPYTGPGKLVNSGRFDRLLSDEAGSAIAESVGGRAKTTYKLKDWVFSRQRYWGEPIPMIHCPTCGVVPVPYKDLPVKLPEVKNYAPTGTGESPLAAIEKWVNVKCPTCKGKAKRETNTMPQWAGSSWYYLRFMDPKNKKALVDPKKEKYWAPVNVYVGGDHAVRHLIYARFWHKFLYDIKSVSTIEPFARLEFLGFILAEDGRKMSKRYGNVINPDDIVKLYGADSMRVYEMFMGPFTDTIAWNTNSMIGARRFIERVWRLQDRLIAKEDETTHRILQQTIKKVGEDIESFKFNTGVSQMMIFVNAAEKSGITKKQYEAFLRVLAPFAPHMTEEIWRGLGNKKSVHLAAWPVYDAKKLVADTVTVAVQINGKSRTTIDIAPDADEATAKETALLAAEKWLVGMTVKRFIYVPGRIASFVV
jgi:leucyl-tRNA synthetase